MNYIQKLRTKIGNDRFIHPAMRIIVENDKQQILVIERRDNGKMGLPAGALEENETIEACVIREVREETGLEVSNPTVIGISTHPKTEFVEYPNGDKIQYFTIEFYTNQWTGHIKIFDHQEVKSAKFMDIETLPKLPQNEQSALESLAYFRKHQRIMLK